MQKDIETKSSEASHIHVKIARPLQSMQAINRVITVMFSYKRSVMYKDIAVACDMHPANISQALSAARDIGLVELAGKKGLYAMTSEGVEYARLLTAGKESEAKKLIRDLLRKNPLWVEIIAFLSATRGQSRDPLDLVLEIERKSGKQYAPNMRNRILYGLVSVLEYAEMIVKEGSKIIPVGEEQIEREGEVELLPEVLELPAADVEFAMLKGDDFTFEVRKDLEALEFAENQFIAWINYLKKKLMQEKQEDRQSGGVPNQ